MPETVFYRKVGEPIAYTEDRIYIYLYDGSPVAHISGINIYSFNGRHLGYFIDGWIVDHSGDNVLCSTEAIEKPIIPDLKTPPTKEPKDTLPTSVLPQPRFNLPPQRSTNWSGSTYNEFFELD